jgi:uncharacterized protein with gpF-like domain
MTIHRSQELNDLLSKMTWSEIYTALFQKELNGSNFQSFNFEPWRLEVKEVEISNGDWLDRIARQWGNVYDTTEGKHFIVNIRQRPNITLAWHTFKGDFDRCLWIFDEELMPILRIFRQYITLRAFQ